ncbi:MAG: bZIP transcription factor [Nannocystaceae bacterium]
MLTLGHAFVLALAVPPVDRGAPETTSVDRSESADEAAAGEVAPPEDAPQTAEPEGPAAPKPDRLSALEARLDALEAENEALRGEVEYLREDHDSLDQRVERILPLTGRLGGYVDFGYFYVGGDGSGIRPDIGYQHFPEHDGVIPDSWVFMGDPLSTMINSRGDPADTGESRQLTFDGVDSRGKSSFIVNALNLNLFAGIGKYAAVEGLFDLVPRGRDAANPDGLFLGDYLDVKLAYLRVSPPTKRLDLDIMAGKINPIFGYEYRIQEAPDRLTVTPSLICRYTCGRPVGVKARARFLESRALIAALSVTNGGSVAEGFGFASDVDSNHFKTVASRLSYVIPVGGGLEIGASGAFGAQDLQPSDRVYQWQYGADLHLEAKGVELTGEFIMGDLQGETESAGPACGLAPCLNFKGAYGLIGYRALNWMIPYFRTDWRSAVHTSGASFVYHSDALRFTPGFRFEVGTNVIMKVEYTVNREIAGLPAIPNDIFTTSVVARI